MFKCGVVTQTTTRGDGTICWDVANSTVGYTSRALDPAHMSLQLSLIDAETAAAPMGLEYHPDFLAVPPRRTSCSHISTTLSGSRTSPGA